MSKPEKIDLCKQHKDEYATPTKPVLIEAKPALYLTIEGMGEPGGEVFQDRIGALYSMAFTIKMTRKFEGRQDYAVGKLEAQWWAEGASGDFSKTPKDQWQWRLLIRTPEFITQTDMDKAVAALTKKGKSPTVKLVKLEQIAEGRCVQMLHVGPYDREGETIAQMVAFAEKQGLTCHGLHHEIYLSDPRRVPPERLKTILRLPVKKA
jgi:hypothetical protein